MIVSGVFVSSFVTNFMLFFLFYGLSLSLGMALSYSISLIASWSYFPNHKGKVTGILTAGTAVGQSVWALITGLQINPSNV